VIETIRVSVGTGAVLGLWSRRLAAPPTTAYLMTYHDGRCAANCQFCPQARESEADVEKLSRVPWPKCEFGEVLRRLAGCRGELERICVQAINYPNVVDDLCEIVTGVRGVCDVPVSISCQPLEKRGIRSLADAGIDRLGIPLDAATPEIFDRIKGRAAGGPYEWARHLRALEEASSILDGRVSTHLIVGLGESEREMIELIQFLHDSDVTVGLFAFTPIPGTPLADKRQPDLSSYRRVQLARHLIVNGLTKSKRMLFDGGKIVDFGVSQEVLGKTIDSGDSFQTSGCPGCNRPFYNESPRGPIYNYPRKLTAEEIEAVKSELNIF
jgi:biotin synthase-related radical SAM superfamily protein